MTALDAGLLLIRVVVGVTMLLHGWNHCFGGGRIAGTASWFEGLGLRPGAMQAWASVVTEFAAGIGLVLGLLTPLAAAAAVGSMTVAGLVVHRKNGFFIFRDGYEYVLMILVVCLGLGLTGPGALSLDDPLGIVLDGAAGGLVTLVAGVGGALVLLAVTWRPSAPSGDGEAAEKAA